MTFGDNRPPSAIETTQALANELAAWLAENPVCDNDTLARDGKLYIDRAKNARADLEAERKASTDPLNQQVKDINNRYRPTREDIQRVELLLLERLTDYAEAEEKRRGAAAEQARLAAEEAERKAREAEQAEREAQDDARTGVVVDVAGASRTADESYNEYAKLERQAARLEREADSVRISGGFKRSMGFRTRETLILEDWHAAIAEMGLTEDITESILRSAKDYRRITGALPSGITFERKRSL